MASNAILEGLFFGAKKNFQKSPNKQKNRPPPEGGYPDWFPIVFFSKILGRISLISPKFRSTD